MEPSIGQHLKGTSPDKRTESGSSRKKISEFSTFLKINKSREQFLITVNSFLPYLRLTVKIF